MVQTGLTIRVPIPSSSRFAAHHRVICSTVYMSHDFRPHVRAGSKRTIQQSTGCPAESTMPPNIQRNVEAFYNGESPLPPRRAATLAKLPEINVDLSASDGTPEFFTRKSIAAIMGGNPYGNAHVRSVHTHRNAGQSRLIQPCSVATSTPLSTQYDINWYLCVSMSNFAWLPPAPGNHGFLHLDLNWKVTSTDGSDVTAVESSPLHLFVGIVSGSPEVFQYYGQYRATSVERLSNEEWNALGSGVSDG